MKLPTSIADEFGIIGCCLLGGLDTTIEAVEKVPSGAFSADDADAAFSCLESMATEGKIIDVMTFKSAWEKKFSSDVPKTIYDCLNEVPSASNLEYYLAPVIESSRKRKIVYAIDEVSRNVEAKSADELLSELEASIGGQEIVGVPIVTAKEAAKILASDLEARFDRKGALTGIETGFIDWDKLTDGLQCGEQCVVAARPGMGKTAIAMNVVGHACLENKVPALVVSLEMSTAALMRRLLSGSAKVSMSVLRSGKFLNQDIPKISNFTHKLAAAPLFILECLGGIDSKKLAAAIRRHVRKHKVKLVVVDYLQKVRANREQEKRTYEVAEVSGMLKSVAASTNTAFLTLAQLNRESEKEKNRVPRLSDLADSGQIERDADTVGLLHRHRVDNPREAHLIIAKQRDGETGSIGLFFDGAHCQFENLSREHQSNPN